MGPRCCLVFLLFLFSSQHASCYSGDPVMYLPPFEVRTLRDGRQPGFASNQQYPGNRGSPLQPQAQPLLHTSPAPQQSKSAMRAEKEKVPEFVEALNRLDENREERPEVTSKSERQEVPDRRSAYDYSPASYGYQPPPYGYQQPSYGHGYHESYAPPPSHHSGKLSLLKPDLSDLVKPVTTKVAGKVSGLIGLVLTLLTGSSPNDVELKGFKDIVINGIVKPLLLAKGGIKSLISKLTIPVISLLLINLEVLITIWWLWEDCPEPHHEPHYEPPPPYSYPKPSYEYNNSYK